MDSLTHAAIGVGVYATSRAAVQDEYLASNVTMLCVAIAGAEWPDVDIVVSWLKGPTAYLYQHRQISHSLPMWFLYSFITAILANWISPGHFWLYWLISFIGTLTHVGTDILTSYGTMALWPIANKRLRGDTLFTIEWGYLIFFIIAVFAAIVLGVPWRSVVYAADILAVVLTLWRIGLYQMANRNLRDWLPGQSFWTATSDSEGIPAGLRTRVVPQWLPILSGYKFIVQFEDNLSFGRFGKHGQPKLEGSVKNARGSAVHHALTQSKTGRAMKWFSPILYVNVREEGERTIVLLADASVRYLNTFPFSGAVDLAVGEDGHWKVIDEGLRAQPLEAAKLWTEGFTRPMQLKSPHILAPEGYRSKVKS